MKNVLFLVFLGVLCVFSIRFCEHRKVEMAQYAIEHNCKWDYNDMCYTREQKPWLFND